MRYWYLPTNELGVTTQMANIDAGKNDVCNFIRDKEGTHVTERVPNEEDSGEDHVRVSTGNSVQRSSRRLVLSLV